MVGVVFLRDSAELVIEQQKSRDKPFIFSLKIMSSLESNYF